MGRVVWEIKIVSISSRWFCQVTHLCNEKRSALQKLSKSLMRRVPLYTWATSQRDNPFQHFALSKVIVIQNWAFVKEMSLTKTHATVNPSSIQERKHWAFVSFLQSSRPSCANLQFIRLKEENDSIVWNWTNIFWRPIYRHALTPMQ